MGKRLKGWDLFWDRRGGDGVKVECGLILRFKICICGKRLAYELHSYLLQICFLCFKRSCWFVVYSLLAYIMSGLWLFISFASHIAFCTTLQFFQSVWVAHRCKNGWLLELIVQCSIGQRRIKRTIQNVSKAETICLKQTACSKLLRCFCLSLCAQMSTAASDNTPTAI